MHDTPIHNPNQYLTVCVPNTVVSAKIEILRFRSAPVFLGTELAKLHFGNEIIVICSNLSGVVNRVVVDDNAIVKGSDELFELRNVNVVRDKSGHKLEPSTYFKIRKKAKFYKEQNEKNNALRKMYEPIISAMDSSKHQAPDANQISDLSSVGKTRYFFSSPNKTKISSVPDITPIIKVTNKPL